MLLRKSTEDASRKGPASRRGRGRPAQRSRPSATRRQTLRGRRADRAGTEPAWALLLRAGMKTIGTAFIVSAAVAATSPIVHAAADKPAATPPSAVEIWAR